MVQHRDLERCKGPALEDSGPTTDWKGFGKALLERYWDGDCGDIDGLDFQDMAAEYGVIVKVPYDPEKHGENEYGVEPGDDWYVPAWRDDLK